jgi:hypothetical protein
MKRAGFTERQTIGVVREHEEGANSAGAARKHGARKGLTAVLGREPKLRYPSQP